MSVRARVVDQITAKLDGLVSLCVKHKSNSQDYSKGKNFSSHVHFLLSFSSSLKQIWISDGRLATRRCVFSSSRSQDQSLENHCLFAFPVPRRCRRWRRACRR